MGAKTNGALAGAGTGAAVGSVIPGVGTAIGAGVGAGVGWLGSGGWDSLFGGGDGAGSRLSQAEKMYGGSGPYGFQNNYNGLTHRADAYGSRQAPQAGQSQYQGQQYGLGQQLMRESNGNGIGAGLIRQQAQGQADRGMRQQMGMAASARPGQGAMASRQAMMNAGNMNAQVGGQSASAQGQYQLGAMQNYGNFLQGARGQDDQMNQFNADARLKQLGLNDSSQLEALRQRLQLQNMQMSDRTQRYGIASGSPTKYEQYAGAAQGLANTGIQLYGAYNQGKGGQGG